MTSLKRRRALTFGFFFGLSVLLPFSRPAWPAFPETELTARAAFLMDAATGQILYQKEPDLRLPPASTTKVVTAIVAIENEKSKKSLLPVTKSATRVPSSKINLRPGQAMTFRDLLYSVLLSSANDASIVLAEAIGGSVARFGEMMTLKARGLGATNSQFMNPHGLTAPGHLSTARDLALIFNYGLQYPLFREIIQTKTISVSSVSGRNGNRVRHIALRNHNRLLWNFDGALGGKTGYTFAAQKCFVGAAARDGTTLIVSILGSRDLWGDTRRLLEYGFDNSNSLRAVSSPPVPSTPSERAATPREQPAPLLSWEEEQRLESPGGYVLQIGSFRQPERAESLWRTITDWGYRAYVQAAHLNNGDITHQVRVGPYPELRDAQKVAAEIDSKTGSRSIILPAQLGTEAEEKDG